MSRTVGGFGHARQQERARMLLVLGLLLLLVVGGVGIFLATSGGESGETAKAAVTVQKDEVELKLVDVLIPQKTIIAGTVLEPHLFTVEKRAEVGLSQRAVHSLSDITGTYARSNIPANEVLIADLVTTVRPTNAISPNIPEGFRAVTINVNATTSVEGWALPGSRVDVVWASQVRGKPGVTVIVQNAKVLSAEKMVDPNAQPNAPVPSTVTLLVTAEDATKIQLASTTGSMSLSLRGDTDPGKGVNGNSLTIEDLLSSSDPASSKKKMRDAVTVKIRGADGKLTEMILDNGKLVPLADAVQAAP